MGVVVNEVNTAVQEYDAAEEEPVVKFDDEEEEGGGHGEGGFEDPGKEDPGYSDNGKKRPKCPIGPFGPRTDEDPNKEPTPSPGGDGPQVGKNAKKPLVKFDDEDEEGGGHGEGGFEDPGKEDPGYSDNGKKRPKCPVGPFGPRTDEDPNKEPTPSPGGDGPQVARNARNNIEKAS